MNLERYGINLVVAKAYADNLELHLECVREAGLRLGVSEAQLRAHDSSKRSFNEFPHYARHFYGHLAGLEKDPTAFERAWLHHLHHNKHHWQHWIFPDGYKEKGTNSHNGILEIPENYLLEMVADWQGACKAYTGTTDMTNWLETNLPKIKLHQKSWYKLSEVLNRLGYEKVVTGLAMAEYYNMSMECWRYRHANCPEPNTCQCDCGHKQPATDK